MHRSLIFPAAVLALTACSTDPTSPASSAPRRMIAEDEPPAPPPPPTQSFTLGRLASPTTYRITPAEALDLMQTAANGVVNNPAYSAAEQEVARQMLAKLPEIREKTSVGYGTVSFGSQASNMSSAPLTPLADAPMMMPDAATYFRNGDEIAAAFEDAERQERAGFSAWGASLWGTVSFGTYGTGYGVTSAGPCDRQLWEWAKAGFTFGTAVVGTAGTAAAIIESGGTALPVLQGMLTAFGGTAVLSAGDLYFANNDLLDCVVRWNSQPRK